MNKNNYTNYEIIGLDELAITNDDIFVRVPCTNLGVNARLVVDDTHQAMLIKDGVLMETLSGGDYPIFDKSVGLFRTEKVGSFRVDVIFISKTAKLRTFWGTRDRADYTDPLTGLPVKVGASGEFEVRVENARKFYMEVIGADKHFTVGDLKERLQGRLIGVMESAFGNLVKEKNISFCRLGEHKTEIADAIFPILKKLFSEEYGLELTSFILSRVVISEEERENIERELDRLAYSEKVQNGELLEVASTRFCIECGEELKEGAKFCSNCGVRVEEKKICEDCGSENVLGAKFCRYCGKKFED